MKSAELRLYIAKLYSTLFGCLVVNGNDLRVYIRSAIRLHYVLFNVEVGEGGEAACKFPSVYAEKSVFNPKSLSLNLPVLRL